MSESNFSPDVIATIPPTEISNKKEVVIPPETREVLGRKLGSYLRAENAHEIDGRYKGKKSEKRIEENDLLRVLYKNLEKSEDPQLLLMAGVSVPSEEILVEWRKRGNDPYLEELVSHARNKNINTKKQPTESEVKIPLETEKPLIGFLKFYLWSETSAEFTNDRDGDRTAENDLLRLLYRNLLESSGEEEKRDPLTLLMAGITPPGIIPAKLMKEDSGFVDFVKGKNIQMSGKN